MPNKILIIGACPSKYNIDPVINAHQYRSQQIIERLINANFDITMLTIDKNSPKFLEGRNHSKNFKQFSIGDKSLKFKKHIKNIIQNSESKAILCLGGGNALYAIKYARTKPLWVDFYGDPLIEKLGQDWHYQNSRGTIFVRNLLRLIYSKADKISVCSESHKNLVTGGMLYMGILSFQNWNESIINVIEYFGLNEEYLVDDSKMQKHEQDKIKIIYNGSINTWTDINLLTEVLNEALLMRPNIEFIQFGQTLIEDQRRKFIENLNSPVYKDRVRFLGKIDEKTANEIYSTSHICISADLNILETRYGWRTRFLTAVKNGLVILATLGNDLSDIFSQKDIGIFTSQEDKNSFKKYLLQLIDDVEFRKLYVKKGIRGLSQILNNNTSFNPMINWLKNPMKIKKKKILSLSQISLYIRYYFTWIRWIFYKRIKA
jgi:glycosyltransferase involved in cell wall biosynthesis